MRQGPLERDEGYIKRARTAIETLVLDGGRHVLFSTDIMGAVDQAKPSEREMKSEEDKFSAIHLLHTSYLFRYGNLNKELHNGSYVGRDKYPDNSGGAHELMFYRPGKYQ